METDVDILVDIALPLTLILIMFGMGMTLTVRDFLRLADYPRAVLVGLGGQLLLLPLVGAALALLWNLPPELAIGVIVLASCPGGTTSNLVSHLARGDVPLSITLTAVNSCIVVFTIPLYSALAMDVFAGAAADVPLPLAATMQRVFLYTILPVSLGMVVRGLAPAFARRIGPAYDRFAMLAFVFIVLVIVWTSRESLLTMLVTVGSVAITLNLIMTALGLLLGVLLAVGARQVLTLGIEIGIQNTVLGMVVAATILDGLRGLDGTIMLMPSAIYGLLMFAPAALIIAYGRLRLPPRV